MDLVAKFGDAVKVPEKITNSYPELPSRKKLQGFMRPGSDELTVVFPYARDKGAGTFIMADLQILLNDESITGELLLKSGEVIGTAIRIPGVHEKFGELEPLQIN